MSKARDLANASTALNAVSPTELGYLDGVTSAVQTQIDSKEPTLPSQTGNSGKYLTTDGTAKSWAAVTIPPAIPSMYTFKISAGQAAQSRTVSSNSFAAGGYVVEQNQAGTVTFGSNVVTNTAANPTVFLSSSTSSFTIDSSAIGAWTNGTSPFGADAPDNIKYIGSTYLMVGEGNKMYKSSNATTWTQMTSPFSAGTGIYDIAGAPGMYIIGCYDGASSNGKVASSPDLVTWTDRGAVNFPVGYPVYVTLYGPGRTNPYVIAGNGGYVASSTNGTTWTGRGQTAGSNAIQGGFYGANKFVLCARNGRICSSTDGATWNVDAVINSNASLQGIAYNGSNLWVTVGRDSTAGVPVIYSSPDAVTWTSRTVPAGIPADRTGYSVLYNSAESLWVIGFDGGWIATSSDGITWSSKSSGTGNVYRMIHDGTNYRSVSGSSGTGAYKYSTSPGGTLSTDYLVTITGPSSTVTVA